MIFESDVSSNIRKYDVLLRLDLGQDVSGCLILESGDFSAKMTPAATRISLKDSSHRHVSLSFRAARREICVIFLVEKVKPDSNDNILFLPGVTCLGWSYDHYTQLRIAIAGILEDQQREGSWSRRDHKTTQRLSFLEFLTECHFHDSHHIASKYPFYDLRCWEILFEKEAETG